MMLAQDEPSGDTACRAQPVTSDVTSDAISEVIRVWRLEGLFPRGGLLF